MPKTIERPGPSSAPDSHPIPEAAALPFTDADRHRLFGHTEEDLAFFQTYQPVCGSPPKDEAGSKELGDRIRAVPKQCWFNARRAVMRLKDFAGASYVEGWAVCDSGMMIEHGWVVRDGVLLDPTLPTGVEVYFPGLEFRGRDEITAFLATPQGKKCKRTPFFYEYGWGGWFSPTMRQAQVQASDFVTKRFCTSR
ncbi:hypothetical protein GobsT_17900 [Gemmata obscuriglobus]|uniref:Uncharacterized protein n=1 Tax=Gemmata obscuriglobus TaxID=114 RepID=A0A2Z3GZ99_9BACT|nr:hypothetical protein [Gemmata obscuriglobus]AWM39839.1 hypothetical protein C1280_24410 [Gemmata obscuriglobus]QEG27037.1 hypothetical protein GobsT_17900 [Gemmata obscuriglobus]VTS03404.1 unnamed protein product [Gemmata obscuriglobus UQM 2246]